jgi:ABC-type nitrate/sulfonate/bicarbonate transport system substrate-binding protein
VSEVSEVSEVSVVSELSGVARAGFDRRGFLRLAGVGGASVGLAMFLAACSTGGGSSSSAGSTAKAGAAGSFGTIALQLGWVKNVEFAGEYFATQKGYYKAAGFDAVTLLAGGGQTPAETVVLSGQALVGMSSIPEVAAAIAKNAPLKVIAVGYQKNPFCLMSLEGKTPIRTVADMKGKRIGVQADNQVTFEGFLKANGLTLSDVDMVATQYSIAPLEAGKYDAHMSFTTNEVIEAQEDGYTPVVLPFAGNGLDFATNPYFVTQDTLDSKRDLLKAFLVAEVRGWTDAVKDPAQGAAYAVNVFGKDQNLALGEQTKEATAQNALVATADTNKHGLLGLTDTLAAATVKSLGDMGTTVTAKKLFDFSLIQEVFKENPDLIVKLPVAAI